MDNKGNGHLTVSELVNLVRAFINHGSNLSIAEALGQIEQFGSDVVTVRKYLNMDVVNDIKKAIGSTGGIACSDTARTTEHYGQIWYIYRCKN